MGKILSLWKKGFAFSIAYFIVYLAVTTVFKTPALIITPILSTENISSIIFLFVINPLIIGFVVEKVSNIGGR